MDNQTIIKRRERRKDGGKTYVGYKKSREEDYRDGFLRGFLVKGSRHKLASSLTRDIVWFSALVFPFYKAMHEQTRVFLFRNFCMGI
jgi:hypothetical protein